MKLQKFDISKQIPVDPLHCFSGVARNRIEIMISNKGNNLQVKQEEKENFRFPHFWNSNVILIIYKYK